MRFSLFLVSHVMLGRYLWVSIGSRGWLLLLLWVIIRLADGKSGTTKSSTFLV